MSVVVVEKFDDAAERMNDDAPRCDTVAVLFQFTVRPAEKSHSCLRRTKRLVSLITHTSESARKGTKIQKIHK